jgi:hypothetical protein
VAHAAQVAPPVPHEVFDSDAYASQVPVDVQQPEGHDVALQTHCPVLVLHFWPVAHALHDAPPAPHDVSDSLESASHALPLQQPAHDVPPQEHVPLVHDCPEPQGPHAAPPVPHSLEDCEA